MVGRGPTQTMVPSTGTNNTYSNQFPQKMESYSIPFVKPETAPFIASEIANIKYQDYFRAPTFFQQEPQYPYDNGIYLTPIEQIANDPYKLLETSKETPVSFQKYPTPDELQNWPSTSNGGGANYLPLSNNKEKFVEKDDDFLTQLLDMSGIMEEMNNELYIPSSNILIPIQTPSPPMNMEPTNQTPDLEDMTLSPKNNLPSSYGSNSIPFNMSPEGFQTNSFDPLVSGVNEGLSPPNNDIYPTMETSEKGDDLQELLSEILAMEDLPLTNSIGGSEQLLSINHIPSNPVPIPQFQNEDESNNVPTTSDINNDITILSFDIPPPTKKLRSSESSRTSMDESPPPSWDSPVHQKVDSPPSIIPSHDEEEYLESPHKSYSNCVLFGQNEAEIIRKLLRPHPGSSSKPVTRDKLVTMPVEDFNALLDEGGLTEIEIAVMKEWRRRGKNKMAAQIARKRKRDELSELQIEIDVLRRQRAQLKQSSNSLRATMTSFKRRAEAAEKRIYNKYSAIHGSSVSHETHNIHVTEDGKTILVPRISTQVLLV